MLSRVLGYSSRVYYYECCLHRASSRRWVRWKHARRMRTVVRAHATSRCSQSLWRTPCRRRLHRAAIPMRYGEGTVKGAATRRLATCNAKRAHWYTCFAALLDAHTVQHTSARRCATFTLKHSHSRHRQHATFLFRCLWHFNAGAELQF